MNYRREEKISGKTEKAVLPIIIGFTRTHNYCLIFISERKQNNQQEVLRSNMKLKYKQNRRETSTIMCSGIAKIIFVQSD